MIVKYVGLTAETSALVERFRISPIQTEDEIIHSAFQRFALEQTSTKQVTGSGSVRQGCDLGRGVALTEGEPMFCFRYKSSLKSGKPEGIALAKGGALYVDGQKVEQSKGSLVQPALQLVQKRIKDVSPTNGGLVSLDAWDYWYVKRGERLVRVGELRPKDEIVRRQRKVVQVTDLNAADLGL